MSDWPWDSPEATRRGLSDLISRTHPEDQRPVRMREVAYRRLLARLFAARPAGWIVKGGVALILRLDPNRTSNDIDISFVEEAGEHAVALEALRADVATDLGDFFDFIVGRPADESVTGAQGSLEIPVTAMVGGREWARFSVDLNLPDTELPGEELRSQTPLTGKEAVDLVRGAVVLAVPQQVADKVCAIFEVHGASGARSSRARDLADIALVAEQVDGVEGAAVIAKVHDETSRRRARGTLTADLPDSLALEPGQETEWRERWDKATRGAGLDFDSALASARAFVDPILSGSAAGMVWDSAQRSWSPADSP